MNHYIHSQNRQISSARSNGSTWDSLLEFGKEAGGAAVGALMPEINKYVQSAAEEQAVKVVQALKNALPSNAQMVQIGRSLSKAIEKSINEQILPQIYNRKLSKVGAVLSDQELKSLYNKGIASIPEKMAFTIVDGQSPVTLNIKNIITLAMPFNVFKEIAQKIDPLITTVQKEVPPVIENRIKDVATLTLMSGFILGGLTIFGLTKLYYSFDK
jgi:hypothetical protein